jgi:hypothetical protein
LNQRGRLWGQRSPGIQRPEFIWFFAQLFRPAAAAKQFSCATKPFSAVLQISGNSRWLSNRQQNG